MDEVKPDFSPKVLKLRKPLQLTKETAIDELELTPRARAFKGHSLVVRSDGAMELNHYDLAVLGLKLAGHTATATRLVDELDARDMKDLAELALSFLV